MPFKLQIITPTSVLLEREDAEFLFLPGDSGDMGVLPGHTPLLSGLKMGEAWARFGSSDDGTVQHVAISGGFAHIKPDETVVLADAAELAEDIDGDRARNARERAEQRLAGRSEDTDVPRAEAALARAMNRLRVAERSL